MNRLLVIRSVSFQQLDASLAAVRARFPGRAIDVLTHEHGRALAASYASVSSVIVYPPAGAFRRGAWTPPAGLSWDAVVVPVANVTGAGFANVFDFAASLTAGAVYRCNVANEIGDVPRAELRRLVFADRVNRAVGALLGFPLGALAAACLVATAGLARLAGHPRRPAR